MNDFVSEYTTQSLTKIESDLIESEKLLHEDKTSTEEENSTPILAIQNLLEKTAPSLIRILKHADTISTINELLTYSIIDRAINLLISYIKKDPQNPGWINLETLLYKKLKKNDGAEPAYQKAFEQFYFQRRIAIIQELLSEGFPEKASQLLAKISSKSPKFAKTNIYKNLADKITKASKRIHD